MFYKNISVNKELNNLIKIIVFLPILFFFLPAMYIPGVNIPYYDLFMAIFLLFICIFAKKLFNKLLNFTKYRFFRVLLTLIIYIITTGFSLLLIGKFEILHYIYGVFLFFIFNNLSWYIYPFIVSNKFIPLKSLMRIFLIAVYIICLYGLFEYFCTNIMHSDLLIPIQHIILNRRFMIFENYDVVSSRLYAVFEEPGYLGAFLCINMPIVYKVIFSKFKILNNNVLNIILKKTFGIVIFLVIIAMQSPIWLIIYLLVNLFYFRRKIFNIIKRYFKFIIVICLFLLLNLNILSVFNKIDISETFIYRIRQVLVSFRNPYIFRYAEPSLYDRIYGYNIRYSMFKDNRLLGVGYDNAKNYSINYFDKIDLPEPIKARPKVYNQPYQISGSILWNCLSDIGIIGTILVYLFFIFNFLKLKHINEKLYMKNFETTFMSGVEISYLLLIILSIYDIRLNVVWIWFLLGLNLAYICYLKKYLINSPSNIVIEVQNYE